MDFLSVLKNKKLTNKLLSYISICDKSIIKTRNSELRQTASCRMWQFKYIVLYLINQKNDNVILNNIHNLKKISSILTNICNLISIFIIQKHPFLYKLIVLNRLENITPIFEIDQLIIANEYENFCMCIYSPINLFILHYFTIIYNKSKFYITSSYGSDFVCVPQNTIELDIMEFNNFCLELTQNNEDIINTFFKKYFLLGNMKKRYNNNTIENINPGLKSKWISSNNGIDLELQHIIDNKKQVGLMDEYQEKVEELIDLHFHNI